MEEKFDNKYRIKSARAPWHNYENGAYFITICAEHHRHYFGEINDDIMIPNPLGLYAENCWSDIPKHFPIVELGPFVLMPNHVHGILFINHIHHDELCEDPVQYGKDDTTEMKYGPQSANMASVIRGYKIGVTKFAHQNHLPFKWQSRYYDHIIRNQNEMNNIAEYIGNNVQNWAMDQLNIIED